jgi:hypothetical protein
LLSPMISILRELLNAWVVYACFLIYLLTLCNNPTGLVSWHHLKENCSVLNIDGSCNVLFGRAGCGRLICRNNNGWVVKSSSLLGISNNNYAEMMDTYQKLCLAKTNKKKSCVLQMDEVAHLWFIILILR